jgi:hypothetical protein
MITPRRTWPARRRSRAVPRCLTAANAARGARHRRTATLALALVLPLAVAACSSQTALDRLRTQLDAFPEYSVVLQDMNSSLFGYSHQYRVLVAQPQPGSDEMDYRETVLDWEEVDGATYSRYEPFLGMVILSKTRDGGVDQGAHPPGYQQVGDERYGQWRQDSSGRSFWEFYGQYALLSNLIGGFGRPIYRDDWDGYRNSRSRGQTYYGPGGGVYGTNGSTTRQTSPDFFRRQQARQAAQGRSFGQRVRSRMAGGVRSFGK